MLLATISQIEFHVPFISNVDPVRFPEELKNQSADGENHTIVAYVLVA